MEGHICIAEKDTVIDDTSSVPGWVTLENPAGQRFPVPEMLADAVVVN